MHYRVGTSGYSYQEWKGHFYPSKLPAKEMLCYYAEHFSTVEINSSFRRFPTAETVQAWAAQVPESFRFVLKGRQTITHFRRLAGAEEQIDDFVNLAALLGKKQGPLLFQLPPNFRKDFGRLSNFLDYVAGRAAVVFQLQHESWFDDETFDCLRKHSAALCCVDDEGPMNGRVTSTADWGYVRLREERYTDAQLRDWIGKIRAAGWTDAYVFFKHEDAGAGPKLASRFLELAATSS